jgi:hypothetical protein
MATRAWWIARLTAAEEAVIKYLAGGTVQSFMLDTGQSQQRVTKKDLASLRLALDSALNRVATLEARLYGQAGQARPGW